MGEKPQDPSVTVFEGIILMATARGKTGLCVQEYADGLKVWPFESLKEPLLTASQARELARQLYRLANRLEKRLAATAAAETGAVGTSARECAQ